MSDLPKGSSLSIALPRLEEIRVRSLAGPSPLEQELIELFDQLRGPLLRYVLSFGLTPHDGEEVVQEVFLALFQHLQRGKSRRNLRGWIFRVGHNQALKLRMRNSARTRFYCDEHAAGAQLDPQSNPEEDCARFQRQRHLKAVIDVMPEQERCCLYLRAEGLRYREISEILGMSLGAVSMSLARSLGRLSTFDISNTGR